MILSFPIRAIPAEPNLIFSFESHQNKNALKNLLIDARIEFEKR